MTVEWLEIQGYIPKTWNPTHGCSPISEGCLNCWAKTMAETRLRGKFGYLQEAPFTVLLHESRLNEPLSWKKPHSVFVVDMGDLFHEQVPLEYLLRIFKVIISRRNHIFFILTKRPQRMVEFIYGTLMPAFHTEQPRSIRELFRHFLPHVWWGVTAENQYRAEERVPRLLDIQSDNLFISAEPLLGPLSLNENMWLPQIKWVIVGGESGKGCRPMLEDWAIQIGRECQYYKVPFYFKQLGGYPNPRHRMDALLMGRLWKGIPGPLKMQEG